MESKTFAYLIGAERGAIRWGRPMIFFAAFFLAGLATRLFVRVLFSISPPVDGVFTFPWLPSPVNLTDEILSALVLAFILLAVFRLIRNAPVAVAVAAIVYAAFDAIIAFVMQTMVAAFMDILPASNFPWLRVAIFSALLVIFVIGGIVLATFLVKKTWLAILVGATAGRIGFRIATEAYGFFSSEKFDFNALSALGAPFAAVLFAALFWLGIWMTAERTPTIDGAKPHLSKDFYAGVWASTGLVAFTSALIILGATLAEYTTPREKPITIVLFCILFLLAIFGAVTFCVLIYKMWAAIQDGHARTTPGKALGFLFIPFFNLYWMFQVFPGFAKDYNAYVDRQDLGVPHLSTALFTAYCALILCGFIPLVGIAADIAAFVVGIAMIAKICDAVNAIPSTS